jgi:hypothetical protein
VLQEMIVSCLHWWITSFYSAFRLFWRGKKHEIASTSWSSCLWKLCELVLNIEEQLRTVFMYTGNLYHLHDLAIWKWHAFVFLSHHFFPMIYDWNRVFFFILVTLHLCLLLIHRYLWNSQKYQILISVNRDLDFFYFLRFMTRTLFFFFWVFVYGKGVQNTCRFKFTNFSQFEID